MVGASGQGLIWIACVGVLFVLFSQLRTACNLGIMERPLAMGFVWGLITGDMTLALSVAVCFELFWLDLIPAGTFVTPNAAAATLAALALTHFFGLTTAPEAVFAILFCLPLGWLGSRLEQWQRTWQNASYNRLLQGIRASHPMEYAPAGLILRSMVQMGVVNFVFFCAALLALISLFGLITSHAPHGLPADFMNWGHLWLAASLGGFMALRTVRAFSVLAVAVALLALAGLALPV